MVKICVLRLSSLGDTVLITPVLKALKHRFPDSHISVLVKKEYAPVFFENPHADELIVLDVRGRHKGWSGLLGFTNGLRAREFDLFLDLHRNLRSRWIKTRIRAKKKRSYTKRHWHRLALVHAKWLPVTSRHTVDLYCDALGFPGIEARDRMPEIYLKEEEIFEAQRILLEKGLAEDGEIVGIHVGARGAAKRWLPDRLGHVAETIRQEGFQPVLLGGDHDRQFVDEVRASMRGGAPVLIQPSLRQLMALIDRCSVLVCHDSGPMHIAVARRVPVVALFGPTHPKLGFWPVGERDVVLKAKADCSPCSLHGTKPCRKKVRVCMEEITADRVTRAVMQVLRERGEKSDVHR